MMAAYMTGREDDQSLFDLWLSHYKLKGGWLKQREDASSHTRQAAELVTGYWES